MSSAWATQKLRNTLSWKKEKKESGGRKEKESEESDGNIGGIRDSGKLALLGNCGRKNFFQAKYIRKAKKKRMEE